MNVWELLERNARKYPENEAIVSEGNRMSYSGLREKSAAAALGLLEQGIGEGDRVILCMPNTTEFVISYFAILRIGAIIVPINAKLTRHEVDYILQDSGAKAILIHHLLREELGGINHLNLVKIKTGDPRQLGFI